MNKLVTLAFATSLFSAVSALTTTAISTAKTNTAKPLLGGNGTTGSWCRANTDCDETLGLCCSGSNSGLSYIQFNC